MIGKAAVAGNALRRNLSMENIMDITGLSRDEIEKRR
jgi:hypothetical protein